MLITRTPEHPIIHRALLPDDDGANINGPCLVRVPDWVPNPLGRYYCYFAHHQGAYIRLAYADVPTGPWRMHAGGVFHIRDLPSGRDHVASPDVHWDESTRTCRLYLHAPLAAGRGQHTFLVCGADGLHFPTVGTDVLAPFYLRVWRHDGWWYGMAKGGRLFRSRDGRTPFQRGHIPFVHAERDDDMANDDGIRHVAIDPHQHHITVYWSSIGDTPERILRASIATNGDWTTWHAGATEEVLRPEHDWEGADLPVVRSRAGAVHHPEHALRDPHLFRDHDGRAWLTYSVAGEQGIALAELFDEPR